MGFPLIDSSGALQFGQVKDCVFMDVFPFLFLSNYIIVLLYFQYLLRPKCTFSFKIVLLFRPNQ